MCLDLPDREKSHDGAHIFEHGDSAVFEIFPDVLVVEQKQRTKSNQNADHLSIGKTKKIRENNMYCIILYM